MGGTMRYALIALLLVGCTPRGWVKDVGVIKGPRTPEIIWEKRVPVIPVKWPKPIDGSDNACIG
jgi:hypothetical protein